MKHLKKLTERLEEGKDLSLAYFQTRRSHEKAIARLKKRVELILEQPNKYFLTYTIAPHKEHVKPEHIYRKIKETALANASQYVINPDKGSNNNRLHFHSVASFDYPLDYVNYIKLYPYGSINIKKIYNTDYKALTEYVAKVQNHAIKDTAMKISYSRRKQ